MSRRMLTVVFGVVAVAAVIVVLVKKSAPKASTNTTDTIVNDRTQQPALAATVDFSTADLPDRDPGFSFSMKIPSGWRVEYLPTVKAINLYTEQGTGTTLDRSQMVVQLPITQSLYSVTSSEKKTFGTIVVDAQRAVPKPALQRNTALPRFFVLTHDQYLVHASATSDTTVYVISRNPTVIQETIENILRSMTLSS